VFKKLVIDAKYTLAVSSVLAIVGIGCIFYSNQKVKTAYVDFQKMKLIEAIVESTATIGDFCEKPESYQTAKACDEYPIKQKTYLNLIKNAKTEEDLLVNGEASIQLTKDTLEALGIDYGKFNDEL
jgi:hypothetical protein